VLKEILKQEPEEQEEINRKREYRFVNNEKVEEYRKMTGLSVSEEVG